MSDYNFTISGRSGCITIVVGSVRVDVLNWAIRAAIADAMERAYNASEDDAEPCSQSVAVSLIDLRYSSGEAPSSGGRPETP